MFDQNWVDEDNSITYFKEEIPLVPPRAPLDSLLCPTLDFQEPLCNSRQLAQSANPMKEMVGCSIEEDSPPTWIEEMTMMKR
jgi:hypothetical protein